jgi:hypothetical protein
MLRSDFNEPSNKPANRRASPSARVGLSGGYIHSLYTLSSSPKRRARLFEEGFGSRAKIFRTSNETKVVSTEKF